MLKIMERVLEVFGKIFFTIIQMIVALFVGIIGTILIIVFVLFIQSVIVKYQKLIKSFDLAEQTSLSVFPLILPDQQPILKVRKQTLTHYNYMLFYRLTPQQTIQVEKYLNTFHTKSAFLNKGSCIDPTTKRKWLLPRITRYYLSSTKHDDDSFLVYGKNRYLADVEIFCASNSFLSVDLTVKNSGFNQFNMTLNIEQQMLMLDFIKQK